MALSAPPRPSQISFAVHGTKFMCLSRLLLAYLTPSRSSIERSPPVVRLCAVESTRPGLWRLGCSTHAGPAKESEAMFCSTSLPASRPSLSRPEPSLTLLELIHAAQVLRVGHPTLRPTTLVIRRTGQS
jgi:hypothetical protein